MMMMVQDIQSINFGFRQIKLSNPRRRPTIYDWVKGNETKHET